MKDLSVLLINPSQKYVYGIKMPQPYPPLGLMYIAAMLEKNGYMVRLLDVDAENFKDYNIIQLVKKMSPAFVGISATTPTFDSALKTARLIKQFSPCRIVMGGIHPTIDPQGVISNREVDAVVIGEGENTVVEIVRAFESRNGNLDGIKGVWYKKNGKIVKNPPRELIEDLDTIPFPARHLLKRPDAYFPADAIKPPVTTLITTRGCPFNCIFCCTKKIFGRKVRMRKPDKIIDEIKYCIEKFGIHEFHIADDCFTISKSRTLEFCEKVKKLKTKVRFIFFNGLRADLVDKDILLAFKSIGVKDVGYGVESGNPEILKNLKKGLTLDKVYEAFNLSRELGFSTWAFFMIGAPGETKKTVRDTLRVAKKLDPDFVKFLILKPYPGTEVYNQLEEDGFIIDKNWHHYGVYTFPVHRVKNLDSTQIQKLQNWLYRSYYMRPKIILKHLFRIRSLSQLWYNFKAAIFIFWKMFK